MNDRQSNQNKSFDHQTGSVKEASSLEKCSFVCHFLTFPLGLCYIFFAILDEEALESWKIQYYPAAEWAIYMPVSALLLFLAAPCLYAAVNSSTVPQLGSNATIGDSFSRSEHPGQRTILAQKLPPEATLPDICDLDPASLAWYSN